MRAYIGPRPRWWLPLVIAAGLMAAAVVAGYGLAQLVGMVASAPAALITPAPAVAGPTPVISPTPSATATASASPSESASASSTPTSRIHVVKPGEYLSQIARLYGVTPEAILRANEIADPNYVEVGQELVIPFEE